MLLTVTAKNYNTFNLLQQKEADFQPLFLLLEYNVVNLHNVNIYMDK